MKFTANSISNMPEWHPNFVKQMRLRLDGNYDYFLYYRVGDGQFLRSTPDQGIGHIAPRLPFLHLMQHC